MSYNLWLSEDSRYTLGFRVSAQPSETPAAPERGADASTQLSAAEIDHIDFLMETLAYRLETTSP